MAVLSYDNGLIVYWLLSVTVPYCMSVQYYIMCGSLGISLDVLLSMSCVQ